MVTIDVQQSNMEDVHICEKRSKVYKKYEVCILMYTSSILLVVCHTERGLLSESGRADDPPLTDALEKRVTKLAAAQV